MPELLAQELSPEIERIFDEGIIGIGESVNVIKQGKCTAFPSYLGQPNPFKKLEYSIKSDT